jgi:hypothetical protein
MAEEKILEDMGRALRAAWRRYLDIVEPIRPGLPTERAEGKKMMVCVSRGQGNLTVNV